MPAIMTSLRLGQEFSHDPDHLSVLALGESHNLGQSLLLAGDLRSPSAFLVFYGPLKIRLKSYWQT